jgi:CelD/BcsL family acetyltransferase involved in cellulose biosynthesis
MTPHVPVWKHEDTHLGAWLGPWRVFHPRLSVQVTRQYTPGALADLQALRPLTQSLPEGQEGWLLYAHPVGQHLPALSRVNGWLAYVPQQYNKYVVDLAMGVEAYWAQFSSKTRFNLKRNVKLFAKASTGGQLDWRTYFSPTEVAEFHRLALPLSQRTYQHKLFQGGLPEDDAFKQRMLAAAARNDVRAYMLWLNDQPVAYAYMEQEQGFLEWAYMGHDHDHASLSPGTVLLTLAIEALQQEGQFKWLDFGSGEGQHKSVFSSQTLPVADVLLLPPTLGNHTIVWLHRRLTQAFGLLRQAMQALGLHSRLKRWLRQKASG